MSNQIPKRRNIDNASRTIILTEPKTPLLWWGLIFGVLFFLLTALGCTTSFAEKSKDPGLRDRLLGMLSGYEYVPSESEVKALGPGVLEVLMEIAEDPEVLLFRQVRAVSLLGYFSGSEVSGYLRGVVGREDQKRILVQTGLRSLARSGGVGSIGFIEVYLKSEDRFVRSAAIEALGSIPEDSAVEVLERARTRETEPFLKDPGTASVEK